MEPTFTAPKERLVGVTVRAGATVAPVPDRLTDAPAAPVRANAPLAAPEAVGENRTVIVAVWLAASE